MSDLDEVIQAPVHIHNVRESNRGGGKQDADLHLFRLIEFGKKLRALLVNLIVLKEGATRQEKVEIIKRTKRF